MTPALRYSIERPRRNHACIRDIFSQASNHNVAGISSLHNLSTCNYRDRIREHVDIYPGVTFVRNNIKLANPLGKSSRPGVKREIVAFSNKSRRNMMVTLAKLQDPLQFWQDFTFSDDVMDGKTIVEKARYSSMCMKNFKQSVEREGFKVDGIWKREWKKRRSGDLQGQYVPHFHLIYTLPETDQSGYLAAAVRLAQIWVVITGTKNVNKALAVALHRRSYRFIESRKQMQKYMSKYMVKNEKNEMLLVGESIGRNWGRLGSPKMAAGEVIEVSRNEMVLLKRCLRKIARRARGMFRQTLRKEYAPFFIMIGSESVIKYIEYLRVNYKFEGVPF